MQNTKIKTKDQRPIGVFDSGVGGLSVLKELKKLLPNENFVFLADQLNVPYGEKNKKQLVGFLYRIADYFVTQHDIKLLIIACNTASCYGTDELRRKYSFLIVRTVPAVKPAALQTKTQTVAVISTPSTSKSVVLRGLIKDNCLNINVLNIGCPNLENTVEKGELDSAKSIALLKKYLDPIKNSEADYLVLGCTHYPFLKGAIGKILGPKVKLIDSGEAIARRTKSLLVNNQMKNNQKKKGETTYVTTGNPVKFSKVASKLLHSNIKAKKVRI